uniref:NADH-ubiquinone oxidoreductase chain 4 n=2 Tax=Zebrias TaxID=244453 RepID=A0A088B147_ZEBZB|nr:NADH dehydrogenase subunit 4 [Zebrias zebra]YP_009072312.1 NADH dehydrogenase subunit 4 [Zebrias zebrinus]AFE62074.1 NADH dehydrogenase subunit 4 [Zebrias zebra]AGH06065.1 NADH dehydrogenase subunit 4 [Zebrias zebrinus]AGH27481.1 NADH dehydrogenase subunit 4 [Zebrias zebrinus]
MLTILVPLVMLAPLIWVTPAKWLWPVSLTHGFAVTLVSLHWLQNLSENTWSLLNLTMGVDQISAPLLVLSCWLLPLMLLASQNHMTKEPVSRQRTYILLLISLQFFLILTFTATEFIMFFMMFEATLIPTLMIITRWGNQAERLNAGIHFLFYTLIGSLPLLVALLALQSSLGTLSFSSLSYNNLNLTNSYTDTLLWAACLIAFLVKLPLYGVHLWLPKAHVEAPIAGSMVLAAVLLKLGGYGMIRVMAMLTPLNTELSYALIILALWGILMASSICLRQTDLKSLIAYSSVSHMGLVVGGILTQTPPGLTGALVLMIAHGLTSSALFSLANTNYERTHSRTMILARGLQIILPLMATWWLLSTLANLALPPLPNFTGELVIILALFNWSWLTLALTGLGMLITAAYSLYMFLMTQRGPLPQHITTLDPSYTREHLLLALHLLPLLALILKPELVWGLSW